MGAWIEMAEVNNSIDEQNVAPLWERGLKSGTMARFNLAIGRSFMGAWIEISVIDCNSPSNAHRSFMGAWIEMPLFYPKVFSYCRSFMGAWIEISW